MLFGEMVEAITRWSREAAEPQIAVDALNDAIEALSDVILCVRLGDYLGGPVTLSLAQGDERTVLVSIPDPTDAPNVANAATPAPGYPIRIVKVAITLVTPSGSETNPSPLSLRIR
jgi:hypothetical protein